MDLRTLAAHLATQVGRLPHVGPWLRERARNYPEGSVVRIASGAAAGLRWQRHRRYVSGYWLGTYELPLQAAFRRLIVPGTTVYDVGANAGFFSLLAGRLVGPNGRVFAFEPLDENVASIESQFDVNGFAHCQVVRSAVAKQTGHLTFVRSPSLAMGHLASDASSPGSHERHEVAAVALDDFARTHPAPAFVKIDVEGAEADVLDGALNVLEGRPTLLIELHGHEVARAVVQKLTRLDYRFEDLDGTTLRSPEEAPHVVARGN